MRNALHAASLEIQDLPGCELAQIRIWWDRNSAQKNTKKESLNIFKVCNLFFSVITWFLRLIT